MCMGIVKKRFQVFDLILFLIDSVPVQNKVNYLSFVYPKGMVDFNSHECLILCFNFKRSRSNK